MNRVSPEVHRQLLLEILDEIHAVCEREGIRYTLAFGSMLGAVRHGGFIPWDDDVDIAMLRSDYDRFCALFNGICDGRFRLIDIHTDPGYYLPFAKVVDARTKLTERVDSPTPIGVYIDIFPLDYCPGDLSRARRFASKRRFKGKMLQVKNSDLTLKRSFPKTVAIAVSKALSSPWSRSSLIEGIEKKASSCEDGGFVGELVYPIYRVEKMLWRKQLFEDGILMDFEGGKRWVAAGYDEILRTTYGDYMQLPPEDQRVTHHVFDAWFVD